VISVLLEYEVHKPAVCIFNQSQLNVLIACNTAGIPSFRAFSAPQNLSKFIASFQELTGVTTQAEI
jgi:hypothetical protein